MTAREPDRADDAAIASCAVAVDVALMTVEDGRLRVLLVEPEAAVPGARWALPGRRVREDETLDDTAHRALAELAGVHVPSAVLEQLRTYGDPGRDPRGRVVSVAYLALSATPVVPDPTRTARMVDVATLDDPDAPEGPAAEGLAYDHGRIVSDALERARARLEYTALATAFLTEPFTIAELRAVYEAVWGVSLDPANFARKVRSTPGFVVPLEETAPPGPSGGRPATLNRRGSATLLHPAMLRERTARSD